MDDRSPGSNPGGLEISVPQLQDHKKNKSQQISSKKYQPEETRNLIDLSQDCVD